MNQETRKKILAAYDLLQEDSTTIQKLESIRTLLRGINPKADEILNRLFKLHSQILRFKEGDVVGLSVEHLPEETREDKNRKKALLLFIRNWNQLKSEVKRVKSEFEKTQGDSQEAFTSTKNILAGFKGPLGIITIAAAIIVAVGIVINFRSPQTEKASAPFPTSPAQKINPVRSKLSNGVKVIDFNGKKIPISALTTGIGPECQTNQKPVEHYHALNHQSAKAIGGSEVVDPGGCGFGKVSDTKIEDI